MGKIPSTNRTLKNRLPKTISMQDLGVKRTRIESALKRLKIKSDAEEQLPHFVNLLAQQIGHVHKRPPNKFFPIGKRSAELEIGKIERTSKDLLRQIHELHAPSVLALADQGTFTAPLAHVLEKLVRSAEEAKTKVPSSPEPVGGRPINYAADAIALISGMCYANLTGRRPTISNDWKSNKAGGPFLTLLTEVFDILEIKANSEAAARKVVESSKREKTS